MNGHASNSPSDFWKSFRSDYFDFLSSSSLQVENTPLRSVEAMRKYQPQNEK